MSLPKSEEWTDPGSMDPVPRRGRTCSIAVSVGIVAVVVAVLIWRGTTLLGLPDIGEPFNVQAQGTVAIPEAENAFTYYRAAVAKLSGRASSRGGRYLNWAQVSQIDRDWSNANLDALKVWLAGTSMDQALLIQPNDQTCEPGSLEVVQNLRAFFPLVQMAGLRMEAQGDLDEAWSLYRAALRCSRHCGMHGGFIERLIGMSMYAQMSDNVRSWADQPNLSIVDLQSALDDLLAIDAMTPPLRQNFEAEYFAFAKLLDQPDLTTWKVETVINGKVRETPANFRDRAIENFWKFALREPERSRRVLRVVWANWLAVSDLAAAERAKRRKEFPIGIFFDPSPDAPAMARRLTPDALNRWAESTRLLRLILPATSALEKALTRERATRASLLIHLAERLYIREHGKPPASVDQLVGPYLKTLPEGYEDIKGKP